MGREEPTKESRNRRVINEEVNLPQTGVITQVREHTQSDDVWNFHVDVRIGPEQHPRKVPLAVPFPDMIAPPRSTDHADGPDLALVQFMQDDEVERPVVTNILYNREDRALLGQEGVIRIKRGDLYIEMAPDGSWARLAKKSEDDGAPSAHAEIQDDGSFELVDDAGMGIASDGNGNLKLYGDTIESRTDGSTIS
jgi:hypothetical protein